MMVKIMQLDTLPKSIQRGDCFFEFGYVSKWGVRFLFQNGYFKGENGHLILRHPHLFSQLKFQTMPALSKVWLG